MDMKKTAELAPIEWGDRLTLEVQEELSNGKGDDEDE